jgi:exosortase A-associated hydrolase 1/exosortase A-associated hydrolase 2
VPASPTAEAFFLPGPDTQAGQRLCIFHPGPGPQALGAVLFVHPFAEEMNKSRRMVALQARALAQAGYDVLQIDLRGCGDSTGDLADASWQDWLDDVRIGCNWLRARSDAPLWLWGLRSGCLVAVQAAALLQLRCNFLFWAPTPSGKLVWQQFMRLKAAGDLAGGQAKATMDALREALAAGRTVEIAGYQVAAALARGLEQATLAPPAQDGPGRMVWLDMTTRPDAALTPVVDKALKEWTAGGYAVAHHWVNGPSFWQTTEIEDAPGLLTATVDAMAPGPGAPENHASRRIERPADLLHGGAQQKPAGTDCPEHVLRFECAGDSLLGIVSLPGKAPTVDTGMIVVVGGPQYRAGSHRQFVLLARAVAEAGYPVLRFDYRGMGDSSGDLHDFEQVEQDLAQAIDAFQKDQPALRRFVVWGLCDGASAALLYLDASTDPRIAGLCLANPWVRSEATLAKAQVKHYYTQRLRQPEFWRKLFSGKVALASLGQLGRAVRIALARQSAAPAQQALPYQERMARAWQRFQGATLLLLSGEDLTAKEFLEHIRHAPAWQGALQKPHVVRQDEPQADHTFSDRRFDAVVARHTLALLASLPPVPTRMRSAAQPGA